jgi:hypothetical protein
MEQATFDPPWDFTNIWGIYEVNSYPFFLPGTPMAFSADLNLSVEASPMMVQNGSALFFYVNVTNDGPDNAGNVNYSLHAEGADLIMNGANQTLTGWGVDNYSWDIGTLLNGETAWMVVNTTANDTSTFYLNSSVTTTMFDPDQTNNINNLTVTLNGPPNAVNDAYTTDEETALDVTGGALLANDNDPNNDTLAVTAFDATSTEGVTVTVDANGNFTYNHIAIARFQELAVGASIVDFFNYTVSDGQGGQDIGMVTITVNGVNDLPIAADDIFSVDEDSGPNQLDVLANDNDPDTGDVPIISTVIQPVNGTVVITGGGTGMTYEPDANFTGANTFNYTIDDHNSGIDTASVTVTVRNVNDPPVMTTTTAPDGVVDQYYTLVVRGTDVDGDTLTFTGTTNANGLTISTAGLVSGTPTASGLFWMLVTVSDGNGGSDSVNLTINIATDLDGDGIPDSQDGDRDGDGVNNTEDSFPDDPAETTDTDVDGIGNNADLDDDGDGVADVEDAFPLDATETVDTDGDGIGDNADLDDDGDGIPDSEEGASTGGIMDYWWIIIIFIIVIVAAVVAIFLRTAKTGTKREDEMREYADAEEELQEAEDGMEPDIEDEDVEPTGVADSEGDAGPGTEDVESAEVTEPEVEPTEVAESESMEEGPEPEVEPTEATEPESDPNLEAPESDEKLGPD